MVEFDREQRIEDRRQHLRRVEDREPPEPPGNGNGDDEVNDYLRMLLQEYSRRIAELEKARRYQWMVIGAIALVVTIIGWVGPGAFLAMLRGGS